MVSGKEEEIEELYTQVEKGTNSHPPADGVFKYRQRIFESFFGSPANSVAGSPYSPVNLQ
jgi:hypothetical protein